MTPSRAFIYLVLVWSALGLLASFYPSLNLLWYGSGVCLLLAALLDALLAFRQPALRLERQANGIWPVDVENRVTLILHNEDDRDLYAECFDHYPKGWRMQGLPHSATIEAGHYLQFDYLLTPHQRGDAAFAGTELRLASSLRLWWRTVRIDTAQTVKVFPDFSRLLGHTLTATDRRAPTEGLIRKRRRGEGTDFRQLREYRYGDSQRTIDWKATAREQKLISREYQEERDQQVVFLLDTGRRMLAHDEGGSHFDHALNAVLTLSFIAQKQGDAIGLMSFGGYQRWLTPQKGRVGLDRILTGVYDLQATELAPDYTLAASALLSKLQKRAFVVLITNLRDEDDSAIRKACAMLSSKHLVLCASMREKVLDDALASEVRQFGDALRYSGTAHYLHERQEAIKRLGLSAAQLIDVTPQALSLSLVNRYLDIKESGQL